MGVPGGQAELVYPPPRRVKMASWTLFSGPKGSKTLQDARKTLQDASRTFQDEPKTLHDAPKTPQKTLKTLPEAPKTRFVRIFG